MCSILMRYVSVRYVTMSISVSILMGHICMRRTGSTRIIMRIAMSVTTIYVVIMLVNMCRITMSNIRMSVSVSVRMTVSVTVLMREVVVLIVSVVYMSTVRMSNVAVSIISMVNVCKIRVRNVRVDQISMSRVFMGSILVVYMRDINVSLLMPSVGLQPRDTLLSVNPDTARNASRCLDVGISNLPFVSSFVDVKKMVVFNPETTRNCSRSQCDKLALIAPLSKVGGDEMKV